MKDSDDPLNIPNLLKEFKIIDQLHRKIKKDFMQSLSAIIKQYFPLNSNARDLSEAIDQYAHHIINASESVIDKDLNYPEYRLAEELDKMQNLVRKKNHLIEYSVFFEIMHENSKRIIVKYFPAVINLSGNGFRLLEANAKLYGIVFYTEFDRKE